jgi:hypothetical protein
MNHHMSRRVAVLVANPWWASPVAVRRKVWDRKKHPMKAKCLDYWKARRLR